MPPETEARMLSKVIVKSAMPTKDRTLGKAPLSMLFASAFLVRSEKDFLTGKNIEAFIYVVEAKAALYRTKESVHDSSREG